jgi:outer membrane receptor protein involved in Fe transport
MSAEGDPLELAPAGAQSPRRPGRPSGVLAGLCPVALPWFIYFIFSLTAQHLICINENVLFLIHYPKSVWWLALACLVFTPLLARAGDPSPTAPPDSASNTPTRLGPVVVTADLDAAREQIAPSLGAVTYSIGPSQIQAMGQGENSTFQQVILHAPGVVQEEFGEIHVRGDHGDVQYRVNGVLLPESLNGFGQEIDTHLIQSVSLITGTMPAQFGDRTAGIIDVTTKTGSQLNGTELSLYGGSYDTFNPSFEMGGTTSNLEYFVAASYLHDNHGIDNTTGSTDPLHDVTDQEKFFSYLSHPFDPTSRLTLLLSSSDAGFQIPDTAGIAPVYQLANAPPADSAAANNYQYEQNYYAVLSYQKYAGNLSYQVSALTRYTDIHFTPDPVQGLLLGGNAARVDNSDLANGLQADASYDLGDHHTLRAGLLATYDLERLDTTSAVFPSSSQFTASPTGETLPLPGGPAPLPGNPPQSSLTPLSISANGGNSGLTAGFYLQDEWKLSDHLTLNYGARYDLFDVSFDNEWQINPRVNLVWKMNRDTTFHLGYARYFMPPTLQFVPPSTVKSFEYTTDAPYNAQDDPPKVERDNYFDMGLSRQINPAWQITGDTFCKLAKHLLDDGQFGTAVILNNFNYDSGTVYGAELSTTYRQGPFAAYGNYSYVQTWARNIDSVENEFPNNELAYLQGESMQLDHQGRFTGSGGVSYEFIKNLSAHADFLYGSGLRAGFANLEELRPYCPLNVGIEYIWNTHTMGIRQLRLRFDCLNVLDETYELRNGTGVGIAAPAYGPRRGFYGGLTAAF